MKKFFSLFGFASLLVLSFAFTPAETASTEVAVSEDAAMFGSGKFYGCAITGSAGVNVTYRLVPNPALGFPIQGPVDCMPDFLTLAPGTWDLYVVADQQAYAFFQWEFCNTPGSQGVPVPGGPTAVFVTSIFIPC